MITVVLFFLLLYVNTLDISAVVPVSFTEDGLHFTLHFELPSFNISSELIFHTNSEYTLVESPKPYGSFCNILPSWVEDQGIEITALSTDECLEEGSSYDETWLSDQRDLEITVDLVDSIDVKFPNFSCSSCVDEGFMGGGFFSQYNVTTVTHDPPLNPLASWENGFAGLPFLSPEDEGDNEIIEFLMNDEPFLRWTNFQTLNESEYQWAESRYHWSDESIPNVFEVYDFSTCNTSLTGTHMKAVIDTSNVCLWLPEAAMANLSYLLGCDLHQDKNLLGCYFASRPPELPTFTFSLNQNGPLFGIPLEGLYIESSDKLCIIQTDTTNEDKVIRFGTMVLKAFEAVAFDYKYSRVGFPTSDLYQSDYSSSLCNEMPIAADVSCQSYVLYDLNKHGKCVVDSTVLSTILGLTLTVFLLSFLNMGLRWLVEKNMTLTHA